MRQANWLIVAVVAIIAVGVSLALLLDDTKPEPVTVPTTALAATAAPATPPTAQDGPADLGSDELSDLLQLITVNWRTDWTKRSINLDELLVGIGAPDPRDIVGGGPIDDPQFETIAEASWLAPQEPGLIINIDGDARFYPLRILTRHEIVNDEIAGRPIAVTYCPLCNTGAIYDRTIDGVVHRFGTSGLLRNSDMVMWDDATDSLWQQITGEAIVGELTGTQLELLAATLGRFEDFGVSHPDGVVLSRAAGLYDINPYVAYTSRSTPYGGFFSGDPDPAFPALSRIVGVDMAGAAKGYPFSVIAEERVVHDTVGGETIVVFWGAEETADALDTQIISMGQGIGTGVAFSAVVDGSELTFSVVDDASFRDDQTGTTWNILGLAIEGQLAGLSLQPVPHRNDFWFAWRAFNPDAPVYGLP